MNRLFIFCVLVVCAACGKGSQQQQPAASSRLNMALEEAGHKIDSGFIQSAETLVHNTFTSIKANAQDSLQWFTFSYNLCLAQGKYQEAIYFADSVIHHLKARVGNPAYRRTYTDALFARGDALYALGIYPAGLRAYYQAQQLGLRFEDECVMGDFSYRLGNINFRQDRFLEAAADYLKALSGMHECQKTNFAAAAHHQLLLNNIGLSFTRAGLADSALGFFLKAKQQVALDSARYSSRHNYWVIARHVIEGNEAEALIMKRQYTHAEALLRNALQNPVYHNLEPVDAMLSQLKLAEVYLLTGRVQRAEALLENLQASPLLKSHARAAFKWSVLTGSLQEKRGDYKAATEALQSAMKYRDQFLEERKQYLLLNLDENIKLMNQADRNTALAAKVERNNLLIIIILLAMLVVILAASFFYLSYRKSDKYVSLLKVLNERIQHQKEQLETTLEELRQSHREKDRIMQMVAHDLRSPVASIYWLCNVMLEEEGLSEEQRNNLQLILLASTNSLSLTKDMLEAVSLLHTREINRTACDLRKLLEQQVQLQRSNLDAKALHLEVDAPQQPVMAQVDAEKFSQVINNLLTNAVKFSREGKRIEVRLSDNQHQIQFSVRDQGIGLPAGQEEKIFEAFSEARRNGTRGEKSYGLGLSISRRIIELHGGTIHASNHPEGGALFIVTMPKEPVQDIR